ncbi:MAG: CHAD domain-containing protein [Acidobacteriota bacterium]
MNSRAPRRTSLLLERLARALDRQLPAAIAGDDKGVHHARVASRRLREAVPVLATGLPGHHGAKARRKIRRLTCALGTVRELDVTLSILDELAHSETSFRTAVEDVRTFVVAERDGRRTEMLHRLERVDAAKLGRRLASVSAALKEAVDEPWRKALSARLLTRGRRLGAAIDAAGHLYDPERLHAVRVAAKKLRYGLELAADSGTRQAAPLVRQIKKAQDMLGRLHDL